MLDAGQNPMLSLLKSLGGGKSDMSSMLPMLMSLMSKPSQKSAKPCDDNSQSAPTSQNGNKKTIFRHLTLKTPRKAIKTPKKTLLIAIKNATRRF